MITRQLPTEPWAAEAGCADEPAETFADSNLAVAVGICVRCAAIEACYWWAFDADPDPGGVWAGLTSRQRRRQRDTEPDGPPHLSRSIAEEPPVTTTTTTLTLPEVLGVDPAEVSAQIREELDRIEENEREAWQAVHRPPAPTEQRAPYIAALTVGDLFTDGAYQRQLDDRRVSKMAAGMDRTLLGVIEVSDRGDGRYAILDGQHRAAAASKAFGYAHPVVCQVHTGLSAEDEARVFYEIDHGRKRLTGWDRWRARRGAGDPVVLDLERIASTFGLRIGPGGGSRGYIQSAAALERMYARGGTNLVHSVLAMLNTAYKDLPDGYSAELVTAVSEIRSAYGKELDADRLVATLAATAPAQLRARAAALREMTPGQLSRLMAAVIVRAYNSRPGPNVVPFLERVRPRSKLAAG